MQNYYSLKTQIDYSQVDVNYHYRLDCAVSDFQKITAFHSEEMGVDGKTIAEKSGAFWVLSKLKFKIFDLPVIYDNVVLTTFPTDYSLVRFMRDYNVCANDKTLISGKSEWCTLDSVSKAIRKTNTVCYPFDMEHKKSEAICSDFIRNREEVCESDFNHTHQSLYTDIDSNGHTNNVAYVRMALNCFSPEELGTNVKEFEIHFLSQTYYKDFVDVYKKATEYGYYIEGKQNNKKIFSCMISVK